MYSPAALICPDTAVCLGGDSSSTHQTSPLYRRLEDYFGVECEPYSREKWNSEHGERYSCAVDLTAGVTAIQDLAIDDEKKASTLVASSDK